MLLRLSCSSDVQITVVTRLLSWVEISSNFLIILIILEKNFYLLIYIFWLNNYFAFTIYLREIYKILIIKIQNSIDIFNLLKIIRII